MSFRKEHVHRVPLVGSMLFVSQEKAMGKSVNESMKVGPQ
jgi:hypothetical protein